MIYAVITGDIINSTDLEESERKKMFGVLLNVFNHIEVAEKKADFKIYRGDSFQGYCASPQNALSIALKIKCALLKTDLDGRRLDARLAIGIGSIGKIIKNMGMSDGEAFRNSGQLLNPKTKIEYKKLKDYKLLFKSPWEDANKEIEVLFSALDGLISKWTIEQAEVIYILLQGKTQNQVAKELKRAVGSISERVQNSNWLAINDILMRYESVIKNKLILK